MSRWYALIALVAVYAVTPRRVQSQTVRESAVIDTGIAPASWHAALLAHRALRDSSRRDDVDILRALSADLLLGRADRVGFVLRHLEITDSSLEGERQLIEARAAYASNQFDQAGNFYAMASTRVSGTTRGLLAARAGDAFERAGEIARALSQYQAAKEELKAIAGWLALREARVSVDSASVLALLDEIPAAAHRIMPLVRGEFYARSGDTARAVVILAGAGFDDRAAELALANGDSANARQLAYRSLAAGDTIIVNHGVRLARSLPPRTPQECLLLAGAVRRQSPSEAAGFTGAAVALGDSSASTLALWGEAT
jgi:hypothetical protein